MRAAALLAVLVTAGCSQPAGPIPASERGRDLFADPALSDSQFNDVSCATCHSTDATRGRRSGHSLHDSAFRPSYWGGNVLHLLDAANACYLYFMRGQAPLDPASADARALYEFLVSISPDQNAPALPLTIVKDIQDVPPGSAADGRAVYDEACGTCHGQKDTGEGRLSERMPILPQVTAEYAALFPASSPRVVVIEKVRHGRFFGVGGTMPPFAVEALSDEELGALLAWLGL